MQTITHTKLILPIALMGIATLAGADVITYSGPLTTTRDQFNSYIEDSLALVEDFEGFDGGAEVGDMPGNGARFAPEYSDGSAAPLPVIQASASAPSGDRWIANSGNGRPAGSSWVIRPDNEGDLIYAFGQANAEGDWVRIQGFNSDDELVVSVDAQPIVSGCFAGFIVQEGCAKVVVTPLGNFDLHNGMDDVQVSTNPIDVCVADLNCDGYLDFIDISTFLDAYGNQQPLADLSGDGEYDFLDISAFLASYTQACP